MDEFGAKSLQWFQKKFWNEWNLALQSQHSMESIDGSIEKAELPSLAEVKKGNVLIN